VKSPNPEEMLVQLVNFVVLYLGSKYSTDIHRQLKEDTQSWKGGRIECFTTDIEIMGLISYQETK